MQIKGWQFKPGLWPTLITILLLPLFISLGFWQLDRAEQRQALHDQLLTELKKEPSVTRSLDPGLEETPQWKKLELEGVFDSDKAVLLDNQSHKGTPGYYVFYPFKLLNSEQWLMVNLGWVPMGSDRNTIPELNHFDGVRIIRGLLKPPPFAGIKLGETSIEKLSSRVLRVQHLELKKLSNEMELPLSEKIMRLEGESDIGYIRDWRNPGSGKEKNIAYAMQWFSFAAILLLIYLILNIKRKV